VHDLEGKEEIFRPYVTFTELVVELVLLIQYEILHARNTEA
jgi:hypothetical protein